MMKKFALLVVTAALALPGAAGAQDSRLFVGAGAGGTLIDQRGPHERAVRPSLNARAGLRVGSGMYAVLEASAFGLGDEEPSLTDFALGTETFVRFPEILATQVLLASLQVHAEGWYLRPGIGIGRQVSPTYRVGEGNVVVEARTSRSFGHAVGFAAGRAVRIGRGVTLAVEAGAVYSKVESGDRTIIGIQLVPLLDL